MFGQPDAWENKGLTACLLGLVTNLRPAYPSWWLSSD